METQISPEQVPEAEKEVWYTPLCRATPLSKYLAMLIFIIMPFVGFWLGYQYSTVSKNEYITLGHNSENIVQTEANENVTLDNIDASTTLPSDNIDDDSVEPQPVLSDYGPWQYTNSEYGFSILLPNFTNSKNIFTDESHVIINVSDQKDVLRIRRVVIDTFDKEFFLERVGKDSDLRFVARFKNNPFVYAPWVYVGENDKYIFLLSKGQDCHDDACVLMSLSDSIIRSFSVPEDSVFVETGNINQPSKNVSILNFYNGFDENDSFVYPETWGVIKNKDEVKIDYLADDIGYNVKLLTTGENFTFEY